LKQEWQKSPAGTRQTDGKNLVWFGEIEKKISQIIKDYFYLPFFLLIILWYQASKCVFSETPIGAPHSQAYMCLARRYIIDKRSYENLSRINLLLYLHRSSGAA
jgi:hypothetical protein